MALTICACDEQELVCLSRRLFTTPFQRSGKIAARQGRIAEEFGFEVSVQFPNSLSTCDLENNLQLDRRAEWKAGDAVNQSTWVLIFAKNPFQ